MCVRLHSHPQCHCTVRATCIPRQCGAHSMTQLRTDRPCRWSTAQSCRLLWIAGKSQHRALLSAMSQQVLCQGARSEQTQARAVHSFILSKPTNTIQQIAEARWPTICQPPGLKERKCGLWEAAQRAQGSSAPPVCLPQSQPIPLP